jgi:hypothetical protein
MWVDTSWGNVIPTTPFCPCNDANLSPTSGINWLRVLTLTSLSASALLVTITWSIYELGFLIVVLMSVCWNWCLITFIPCASFRLTLSESDAFSSAESSAVFPRIRQIQNRYRTPSIRIRTQKLVEVGMYQLWCHFRVLRSRYWLVRLDLDARNVPLDFLSLCWA